MDHSRHSALHCFLLLLLSFVMAGFSANAQTPAILDNGYRNAFGEPAPGSIGGEPAPVIGDPLLEAYESQGQDGTAFGGFSVKGFGTLASGPASLVPYDPAAVKYPESSVGSGVPRTVQLRSSKLGRPVVLSTVSYNFGGIIPPPVKVGPANQPIAGFYREEPLNARLKTTVVTTNGVVTSTVIEDATNSDLDGTTTTTSGNDTTTVTVGRNPQFYWSPHARKVYATQPGTIVIRWREEATTNVREETYIIATSPDKPERTIFWTENGFNGPLVEVPAGRINAANIIYNSLVPESVSQPYQPWLSGRVDFTETDPALHRYKTFYYENNLIHAYNVEGRVFVEYLGNPRGDGTSEQKGYEIVNIIKETTPKTIVVNLGEKVGHARLTDENGIEVELDPKVIAGLGLAADPYVHQHLSSGGTRRDLYAIRKTQPGIVVEGKRVQTSNEVLIYWQETGLLDLKWPKQYVGYILQWPGEILEYSIYARPDSGVPGGTERSSATAVQLDSASNPALVYQDDPNNSQARLLPGNLFQTDVTQTRPTNRALLRFTVEEDIWFERVYSQLDPYFLDPAQLLANAPVTEIEFSASVDEAGFVSLGYTSVSNVRVFDGAGGSELVEGEDYLLDAVTGDIRILEPRYHESVASLGSLNAGDQISIAFLGAWDTATNRNGRDWEVRRIDLSQNGGADSLGSLDFRDGPGTFDAMDSTASARPWQFDGSRGVWFALGTPDISSTTLVSPDFAVEQAGEVTLRFRHRYRFQLDQDGGQIRFRANQGPWQTVATSDFSSNGYGSTLNTLDGNGTQPSGSAIAGEEAFSGISPGFFAGNPITTVRVIFDAPQLPFSRQPAIVDADIGIRLEPDARISASSYGEEDPVFVGYIHQESGDAFNVDAYKDPFVEGFEEASRGAIIGVNAVPGNDQLEVWWYRKSAPDASSIRGTFWPSFVQRYRLRWPANAQSIVLASNRGSDDLPSLQATGELYFQNDPNAAGWNPNEEHALMLNGRAWALRDDLNRDDSSEPYVLLQYTEADQRPAMRVFKVERGVFDYPAVAGKVLQAPMPLPLLPPPLLSDGTLASYELPGSQVDPFVVSTDLATTDSAFAHYQKFTWSDRKGTVWVYRGPHEGNQVAPTPTIRMRYFYQTLPGFYFPGVAEPPVGTIVPFLRDGTPGAYALSTLDEQEIDPADRTDQPLDIVFRPRWPETAPQLRVGETLTLAKLGLPSVRGQTSAELIYQQSVARDIGSMADRQKSARLFDPTRAKAYLLGSEAGGLNSIPDSVNTSPFLGKLYFPNLPPHLSSRLFFDPAIGPEGALVFTGVFMDELVGEKYLQLNVMSAADIAAAKALTPDEPANIKQDWDDAIDGLATTVETFIEDPSRLGTYIPLRSEVATPRDPIMIDGMPQAIEIGAEPLVATAPVGEAPNSTQRPPVGPTEVAEVHYSDTAVDSYAVSASGGGSGFVVLALGNGKVSDFTPEGEPVSLQVFKVNAPLYRGELKVINSSNPLDEKLTLQHTGDFAGHPEDYDFEWRYSPPVDGLPRRIYSFARVQILGDSANQWQIVHNPVTDELGDELSYSKYRESSVFPDDRVTSIAINSRGSGYTSPPDVLLTGGGGSGATAEAQLSNSFNSIVLVNRGRGYSASTTGVSISGGGGFGASATAVVRNGRVTAVNIINPGANYTSPPLITISGAGSGAQAVPGFGLATVQVTNGGIAYTSAPSVQFNGGTGSGSTATASIGSAEIVAVPGPIEINNGHGSADHGVSLPQALLRRVFSVGQNERPLRLFLSLDLASNDGAVVYLNEAPVASLRSPAFADTPTSSVPATTPPFDPLPFVFEIDPDVLVADGIPDNNVVTVELFTSSGPGARSNFNLRIEGSREVENLTGWLPVGLQPGESASTESMTNDVANPPTTGIVAVQGKNRHTIQGSSILTLSDNYLVMRYRARKYEEDGGNEISPPNAALEEEAGWSKWTEPQLAEGWIKRVLAGINPFQQRVRDLFNHEINTSVSLVEQAGRRWEGDIALNLDNINDSGLIEIYETVLNRGRMLSIEGTPAINYGGANDALLLASGYLNDLYMILGNEAFADAANSTIAYGTEDASFITEFGDVATSLFSFKGQLATVLEEELALLRGRDDFLLPGARTAPIYNRLIWNYTRGIDSGEAVYALNYNIKDRAWDFSINPNNAANQPTDGIVSAADAAITYPQGHGDAYGHFLTALSGYYGLLNNPNFSWTPRIEAVLVLGTPVSVDYQDERKFASAAAALSRTASQVLDLTYRQDYSASEEDSWTRLSEEKSNPNTGLIRTWGTDHWASRGGQGALFHWVTANSLLPAVDPNPNHSGIQKIDRTTVPELAQIAAEAAKIQQTLDNADGQLNPLGLANGALAFDISPAEVDEGYTHFEQVHERAIQALGNAADAFDRAKGSTQFLRQQEDTLAGRRFAIEEQERAFTNGLIELYGTPYTDDIGPGKTYKQGYDGPDLFHYMYVDLPEVFTDYDAQTEYPMLVSPNFADSDIFDPDLNPDFDPDDAGFDSDPEFLPGTEVTYTLNSSGEFARPEGWNGRRISPGKMQTKISEFLLARGDLEAVLQVYEGLEEEMNARLALYESAVDTRNAIIDERIFTDAAISSAFVIKEAARTAKESISIGRQQIALSADAAEIVLPTVAGPFAFDPSFSLRGSIRAGKASGFFASDASQAALKTTIAAMDTAIERINFEFGSDVTELQSRHANRQLLYELHFTLVQLKYNAGNVDAAIRRLDQAQRNIYALQAEGNRIQKQRLVFRQHSAAIIQGYRTRDFAFRAFRDEALERYKSLFDLAAQYTYLAARAYDYETGLLDPDGNSSAATFYEKIVQARALGVITGGQPQFAGSENGDPGLSGVLAELSGDWSVARTRLGFNNPDNYATTFSLRQENFRLLPGAEGDLPWRDKLSSFRVADLLSDPDVRRSCMQVADPNGGAVPGIVIPFSTTIANGYNFFGKPLAGGDHTFTPSSFSTKIRASGIAFSGYIGMDSPTTTSGTLGDIGGVSPSDPDLGFSDPNALSATPYVYLIPVGADTMRAPPLGDTSTTRTWVVEDQAIPLPFNIADSDYSTQPAWVTSASLSEPAFVPRKHQAFRAVPEGTNFQDGIGFTNARLIGRSAWNTQWKIVIPGNTLLNDPERGLQIFIDTVQDIQLYLQTYSYSGN